MHTLFDDLYEFLMYLLRFMFCLGHYSALPSKVITSCHRVIISSWRLMSSKEVHETLNETVTTISDNTDNTVEMGDLPDVIVDSVKKEQLLLSYSQKALKTLKLDEYPYYVEREWWKHGNRMTFWATWLMKKDVKRRHLLAELGPDRVRLKALKCNTILPELIRDECAKRLHNFPKASCPKNVQHLCQFSGARRGKLNRFHLHRQIFRRLADHGQLSGIQRSVW